MTDGAHIRLMVTRGVKRTPNQDPRFVIGKATIVIVAEYKTPKPEAKARGYALLHVDLPHQRPRPVRPAPQFAQPAEPDPGADPGDQGRRRRSADARPARLRRELQLDQLLHRARRRAVDVDRRLFVQGHHPAQRDRRLARRRRHRARMRLHAGPGVLGRRGLRDRHARRRDAGDQGRRPGDRRRARPARRRCGPASCTCGRRSVPTD